MQFLNAKLLQNRDMYKRRLLAAEIFGKMSGVTSSRGRSALSILRLG